MQSPDSVDLLENLAQQEEAIADLYSEFRNALPDTAALWKSLVLQEKAHGDVLRRLAQLFKSQQLRLNTSKFNVTAVKTNIARLKKETERVASEGTTPIRAFSLAADIEHSLIESGYFQIIETDITEMKNEIEEIERHTRQHIKLVENGLNKARANNQPKDISNGSQG